MTKCEQMGRLLNVGCLDDFSIFNLGSFFTIFFFVNKKCNPNNTFQISRLTDVLSKDTAPRKLCIIHSILVRLNEKDVNAELCCFAKFCQTAPSRNMHAYACC